MPLEGHRSRRAQSRAGAGRESRRPPVSRADERRRRRGAARAERRVSAFRVRARSLSVSQRRRDRLRRHDPGRARRRFRPERRRALVLIARASLPPLVVAAASSAAFGALAQTAAIDAPSIRDGVFTPEQARRGKVAYTGPCDRCHGFKLDGAPDDPDMLPAPPVAGPKFLRKWNGRTLVSLFEYVRTTMPSNNPGYL